MKIPSNKKNRMRNFLPHDHKLILTKRGNFIRKKMCNKIQKFTITVQIRTEEILKIYLKECDGSLFFFFRNNSHCKKRTVCETKKQFN